MEVNVLPVARRRVRLYVMRVDSVPALCAGTDLSNLELLDVKSPPSEVTVVSTVALLLSVVGLFPSTA